MKVMMTMKMKKEMRVRPTVVLSYLKNVILKSFNVMLFVNYKCVIPRMILICLLQILTKPKSFCKHLCLSNIFIILYSPNS